MLPFLFDLSPCQLLGLHAYHAGHELTFFTLRFRTAKPPFFAPGPVILWFRLLTYMISRYAIQISSEDPPAELLS